MEEEGKAGGGGDDDDAALLLPATLDAAELRQVRRALQDTAVYTYLSDRVAKGIDGGNCCSACGRGYRCSVGMAACECHGECPPPSSSAPALAPARLPARLPAARAPTTTRHMGGGGAGRSDALLIPAWC